MNFNNDRLIEILFYYQMRRINTRCNYSQARPVLESLAQFMLMNNIELSTLLKSYTDITRMNRPSTIEAVHTMLHFGFNKTDISHIMKNHYVTVDRLSKVKDIERRIKPPMFDEKQLEVSKKFIYVTGVFYDMFLIGSLYNKVSKDGIY